MQAIDRITGNMKTLDYLNGEGLLRKKKRKMVEERFLFIGLGGTGSDALCKLKHRLSRNIDPADFADRAAFLAIDTAHVALDTKVTNGLLDATEIIKLPYENAQNAIHPEHVDPIIGKWVNPSLYAVTTHGVFDGNGAGTIRQAGRVLLSTTSAVALLNGKLWSKIMELCQNKTPDKLQVMILTGVAGGTGSGTVVDMTYIVRQILKNGMPALYNNARFSGYIFLPAACGHETDPHKRSKGNRNAYAALKEIDHFMTLSNRNEKFTHSYGAGLTVNLQDDIFDLCTLIDGRAGGMLLGDPKAVAFQSVSDCIMNFVTVQDARTAGGGMMFLADEFLANASALSGVAVAAHRHPMFPRDAYYKYSVLGYAEMVVPIELLTTYLAKRVFDAMWDVFLKNKVRDGDVDNIMSVCALSAEQIFDKIKAGRGVNNLNVPIFGANDEFRRQAEGYIIQAAGKARKEIGDSYESQINRLFGEKGPYFVINLTSELIRRLATEIEIADNAVNSATAEAAGHSGRSGLKANLEKHAWELVRRTLTGIKNEIVKQNNETYDVYTKVLDQFKIILDKNSGIMTNTLRHNEAFGQTYYWSPVNLLPGNESTKVVTTYLDGLVNQKVVGEKSRKFVADLQSKRQQWTDLSEGGFDAAEAIREFMESEIKGMVDATLEDFLIKFYSKDPNAKASDEDGKPHPAVDEAADEILKRLWNTGGKATPLVGLNEEITTLHDLTPCAYMVVPSNAPNLYKAICGKLGADSSKVYKGTANDTIVCYKQYVGIPLLALEWTREGETDYELKLDDVGLHMDESRDRDWRGFPNLTMASMWEDPKSSFAAVNPREDKIAQKAHKLLDDAERLGLITVAQVGGRPEYTASLLMDIPDIASALSMLRLTAGLAYEPADIINDLKAAGLDFAQKRLWIDNTESSPGVGGAPAADNWHRTLAGKMLRKMVGTMHDLEKTVVFISELSAEVGRHNQAASEAARLKALVGQFAERWYCGVLTQEEESWVYIGDMGRKKLLWQLEVTAKVTERYFHHYFAFTRFCQLDEAAHELLRARQEAVLADPEQRPLIKARREEYKRNNDEMLCQSVASERHPFAMQSFSFESSVSKYSEDDGLAGKILDFYQGLALHL